VEPSVTLKANCDVNPDAPSPGEVRAALGRLLASEAFRTSPQLSSFLSFVVEAELSGSRDRIKAYTIGVEILRRPAGFDPQFDPTVRVEATRLRRALDRYYAGSAIDRVIIGLPRGSYVPTFTRRKGPDIRHGINIIGRLNQRSVWATCGLLIAASVIAWFVWDYVGKKTLDDAGDWSISVTQLPAGNGMPAIMLQNFEILGTPNEHSVSAPALRKKIRDTFARFETINILPDTIDSRASVEYRLLGFADYPSDGNTRIRLTLLDVVDGNVVWSQTFAQPPGGDREAFEEKIAAESATVLLQPFGLIRARDYNRQLMGGASDPRYRCLLLASDAFRSFYPDAHERARKCLERLIMIDRGFGLGFSYLAGIYNQEWGFGFGKAGDDPNALDIALANARRGVELLPDSARAWHILSTVLFNRRDTPAAIAAIQKSIALNPYDTIVATDFGGRLVSIGEIERGMTYLERSPRVGGVRPIWQHFFLFLGNYMRGKLPEATSEADEMTSDVYTFGYFARALTAAVSGNKEKAQVNWTKLIALRPAWRDDPRAALARFISSPAILDRLTHDLAANGLGPAK
jgi:tetratricopeptide (TPR) repeat protein